MNIAFIGLAVIAVCAIVAVACIATGEAAAYINQLKTYYNYIFNKTKKKVNVYLYSILLNKLVSMNDAINL